MNTKIARIDQPAPGLLCLTIRTQGKNGVLVLSMLPGALGAGIVEKRPRGASASPAVSQLRRHAEGATIEAVEASGRVLRISLTRAGARRFLVCAARKPYGAWWLTDTAGSVVVRSPGTPAAAAADDRHLRMRDLEALRGAGEAVLETHRATRTRQVEQLMTKHVKRLQKKRDAIIGDLERANRADELHEKATLILANSSEIPPNSRSFEATTWEADPRTIEIELDPSKSPIDFAQELFRKAKRLKRGLDVAPQRLRAVEAELDGLERLRRELGRKDPETLALELQALGVSITAPREEARKRRQAGARLPYREFVSFDGTPILVGRGAADNDRLTLRVAKPHHLWLHARGVTGAHVVVPLAKGKSCAAETLVDAATLAAHFSDLRGEVIVDVLYTPRRFVQKRKGGAVGSVTLTREKVIGVRIEPARLERLLLSEKRAP